MIDLCVRVIHALKVNGTKFGRWLNFIYVYDTKFHEESFIVKVLLLAAG
jgi:hypothetical protein